MTPEQAKAYYWKHVTKINARSRAYYKKHRKEHAAHTKAYRKKHAAYYVALSKKQVVDLTNSYVAGSLGLKINECPKILLETKRIQLMLHRAAKG